MKFRSNDPRAVRTRQRLLDGLMQIVIEKPFREVTVSDITKRAEVNRATFYLHYEDKYDLLEDCAKTMLDGIRSAMEGEFDGVWPQPKERPIPFDQHYDRMRIVLEHFKKHKDFFLAVMGVDGDPLFRQLFREGASTWIKATLKTVFEHQNKSIDDDYIDMMVRFQSAGNFDVLIWWLEQDNPAPIDIMAQRLAYVTLPPLVRLIEDGFDNLPLSITG